MNALLDFPPLAVRDHFRPHTDGLMWHRVPGGFSGATVWHGEGELPLALKAWPTTTTREHLSQIHAWMTQAAQLSFVPAVCASRFGQTICIESDRVWDCCRWMPGVPLSAPTSAQVATACEAIAHLHEAWASETQRGPSPGVQNRLRVLAETESLLREGPDALPPLIPAFDAILRRALTAASRLAPSITQALRVWEEWEFSLQPSVRDLRGEHVLFEGNRVSGIIDFGAMAVDHPAADLARFLGDVANFDNTLFAVALNSYRAVRPTFDATDGFVSLLARTGTVCSVLGWLVRLVARRECPANTSAISARLEQLVTKIEQFAHF